MKNIILSIALVFLSSMLFAQQDSLKELKMSPPGTVWLHDNIYIDMVLVTNADYSDFLYTVADYYSPETQKEIQNIPLYNLKWKKFFENLYQIGPDEKYLKQIELDYFKHLSWTNDSDKMFSYFDSEEYAYHPVINVSYEQANEYCKWRTDMVKLAYSMNTKNKKQRAFFYTNFQYRLPTQKEWEEAYAVYEVEGTAFTHPIFTQDVEWFMYTPGNVSEMLLEKGKAIGLSWNDEITKDDLLKIKTYKTPSDWLGFRCVCEILEN